MDSGRNSPTAERTSLPRGNNQGQAFKFYRQQAEALAQAGKLADAADSYRQAYSILERDLGPTDPRVGATLNDLADVLQAQEKYLEAEALYQQALKILKRSLGNDHPEVARVLKNLAELEILRGCYWRAEALSRRSFRILEEILRRHEDPLLDYLEYDPETIAVCRELYDQSLIALAMALYSQGRHRDGGNSRMENRKAVKIA